MAGGDWFARMLETDTVRDAGNNTDDLAQASSAFPSTADAIRAQGQHDPYCPQLYPSRTFTDRETGDQRTLGPEKYLCHCEVLAAVRAVEGGETALRVAYVRGRLEASSGGQ